MIFSARGLPRGGVAVTFSPQPWQRSRSIPRPSGCDPNAASVRSGWRCWAHLARPILAKPAGSTPAATAPQRRDYQRHWTPVHLDFVVPDVAPAVRRAEAAGVRLEEEIRTPEYGRIAVMADSDWCRASILMTIQ